MDMYYFLDERSDLGGKGLGFKQIIFSFKTDSMDILDVIDDRYDNGPNHEIEKTYKIPVEEYNKLLDLFDEINKNISLENIKNNESRIFYDNLKDETKKKLFLNIAYIYENHGMDYFIKFLKENNIECEPGHYSIQK
jgi:hypothetical protein